MFLYDTATLQPIWQTAWERPPDELSWSVDSTLIAGLYKEQGKIIFWDSSSGEVVDEFRLGLSILTSVWSPDGTQIATAWGGTKEVEAYITVWDVISHTKLWSAKAPRLNNDGSQSTERLYALAWSPDGKFIAATMKDHYILPDRYQFIDKVVFLDAATGNVLREAVISRGLEYPLYYLTFSPDSHLLAGYTGNVFDTDVAGDHGDSRTYVIDTELGQMVAEIASDGEGLPVYSATWSLDNHMLAIGSGNGNADNGSITVWDATSKTIISNTPTTWRVNSMAWSTDGKRLAASGWLDAPYYNSGQVSLWDVSRGVRQLDIKNISGIDHINWLSDGDTLITRSAGQIALIDTQSETVNRQIYGSSSYYGIDTIGWSSDGRYLIGISRPEQVSILIWDTLTGQVNDAADLPSSFLASGVTWNFSQDGGSAEVYVRPYGQEGEIVTLGNPATMTAAARSADMRWLATAGSKSISPEEFFFTGLDANVITLWDIASQTPIRRFIGHTGPVTALFFSPDSQYLASGSVDGTIIIWPTEIK